MVGSPAQFKLDVRKWVEKAKANTREVVIEAIQDINEQVVVTTPVVTGFLRASWFASLNQMPGGQGGGGSVAQMNVVAGNLKLGDVFYAGNSAVYARRVEYGFVGQDSLGRNYNQAGRHWVQAVMLNADQIAAEAARRVASR